MRPTLSLKSLFGTLGLLLVFVVLIIISIYSNTKSEIFYLIATLLIGTSISLISCIQNMNYTLKIKKEQIDVLQNDIFLSNCPEYWIKHTVTNPENNKTVNMCYNNLTLNQSYSYNDNIKQEDMDNYVTEKQTNGSPIYNIGNLRNRAKFPEIETFTNDQYFYGHPEFQKHYHKHNDVKVVFTGNEVSDAGSTKNIQPPHSHSETKLDGSHSHAIGADSVTMDGKKKEYVPEHDNFDYWINPYTKDNGDKVMEINLEKLNETENKCDLARQFPWTEAYSKCS
jgi:hypothetical protein